MNYFPFSRMEFSQVKIPHEMPISPISKSMLFDVCSFKENLNDIVKDVFFSIFMGLKWVNRINDNLGEEFR